MHTQFLLPNSSFHSFLSPALPTVAGGKSGRISMLRHRIDIPFTQIIGFPTRQISAILVSLDSKSDHVCSILIHLTATSDRRVDCKDLELSASLPDLTEPVLHPAFCRFAIRRSWAQRDRSEAHFSTALAWKPGMTTL